MIFQDPLAYLLGLEGIALLDAWAGDHDREFTEARLAEIRRLADEPGVALDAACGTGRFAEFLAKRGHRVIGNSRQAASRPQQTGAVMLMFSGKPARRQARLPVALRRAALLVFIADTLLVLYVFYIFSRITNAGWGRPVTFAGLSALLLAGLVIGSNRNPPC